MTDDLLTRFTDPAPRYGPLPIWWWSGARVTRERLRWQMEQLIAGGVRQAVVLCLAPTGPTFGSVADDPEFLSPAWLELFDGACADAADLGFTLWLYDQIGFSGANFQGGLVAAEPSFAGQALYRTEAEGSEIETVPPASHEAIAAYAVLTDGSRVDVPVTAGRARWSGAPARLVLVHAGVLGFNYFDPDACAALLDRVHGTLERSVGHWFGSSVGGFFQDEMPPMPTWGQDFAETFAAVHGYDLRERLWALWEADTSPEAAAVRRDYHAHRATLGRRGFFDQHDAWFAERGLICGFDQASPAREGDPVGGVATYGDYLRVHTGYGAPGSDHWGDAKVHSSLAHANGHERVWIEAFHSSGWGGTLEETYDWLSPFLRRGANLYDPHAVYYSTVGGWWEWAPPSTCWRQPYWPVYPVFATAVARLCSVLTAGDHQCDVLLLSPTTGAQAHVTLGGALPPAREATLGFRDLNGVNTWFAERHGVLEAAGIDHDALDEATLAAGTVTGGVLTIARATYRTVVLPPTPALDLAAAERLVELAGAGGRVVCVGAVPGLLLGGDPTRHQEVRAALAAAAVVVGTAAEVPAHVLTGPVRVDADVMFVRRRVGSRMVLGLSAHDEHSGTAAPILDLTGDYWQDSDFSWPLYNTQLRERGYRFVPPAGRIAHVRIEGLAGMRAQSWSPGTGARTELAVTLDGAGFTIAVPFDDGATALVVLGPDLPEPTAVPLGPPVAETPLRAPWRLRACSTLDNRWGDLAAADRSGVLPIEVWRAEHSTDGQDWTPVTAGFGPFARQRGHDGKWHDAVWSQSRGIADDPVHHEYLGPKGNVPQEFLEWPGLQPGDTVAVRTHLDLPDDGDLHLVIGAGAPRTVRLDGAPLPVDGAGYQSVSPLPNGGRRVALDIELTAEREGPLRASFAVVRDVSAYLRPEWLRPSGPLVPGQVGDVVRELRLDDLPADATVQVSADGPCSVLINGTEVGRQSAFNPYPHLREVRVHTYDLGPYLRTGANELVLRLTDLVGEPTAATLDSSPTARGGLGVQGNASWTARRDGVVVPLEVRRLHRTDPAFPCLWTRPHPLPGTHWLELAAAPGDVVVPLVPDLAPGGERTEWLRLMLPPGTVALTVPTDLEVVAQVDGHELKTDDGRVTLPAPAPAGTAVTLRVSAVDGRRGGALLDGPVSVELADEPMEAPLLAWDELGMHNLGGHVTYVSTVNVATVGGRSVLDLGEVRGTAEVTVNGRPAGTRVWGPWHVEVTGLLRPGPNAVEVRVRGTLAGYLDDASPTSGVYAGQVRSGLFGPVRLIHHEEG